MHSSLIGKVEKANRYARELDRITIDRVALTFRGDNDTHHVSLDSGQWHCTCHYFDSWRTCVRRDGNSASPRRRRTPTGSSVIAAVSLSSRPKYCRDS